MKIGQQRERNMSPRFGSSWACSEVFKSGRVGSKEQEEGRWEVPAAQIHGANIGGFPSEQLVLSL